MLELSAKREGSLEPSVRGQFVGRGETTFVLLKRNDRDEKMLNNCAVLLTKDLPLPPPGASTAKEKGPESERLFHGDGDEFIEGGERRFHEAPRCLCRLRSGYRCNGERVGLGDASSTRLRVLHNNF